jgi:formylglycine-generating enzyme required for sulfatase activity
VTNAQFAAFAKATGWQTDAERFGWSYVFRQFVADRGAVMDGTAPPATPDSGAPRTYVSWLPSTAYATRK